MSANDNKIKPPVWSGNTSVTSRPPAVPVPVDKAGHDGKASKGGNKSRNYLIAVIALLAVTQLILILMIAPKSCTRTQVTSSGVVYEVADTVKAGPNAKAGDASSLPYRGYAPVVAPQLPISMAFAGENIDFDRIDMAERLDRELSVTIFSHMQSSLIIKRANRYFPILIKLLKENDVPEDLVYLAVAESSLDPSAVSGAHAAGMWQFMPATGREYGLEVNENVDERFNVEKETVAACNYLKKAYAKYGNWATTCASYNAGMGRIASELDKQQQRSALDLRLVSETSRYVFRILAYKIFLSSPKQFGYRLTEEQLYQPIDCDVVEVITAVDSWIDWAAEHGITYAQLREANPWIRSNMLPNDTGKVYKVKVPKRDSLYRSKAGSKVFNHNWIVE